MQIVSFPAKDASACAGDEPRLAATDNEISACSFAVRAEQNRERVVMRALVARFCKDQSGSSAVEYAVIAGIIGLGIIASVGAIRDSLNLGFNNVQTELGK
jgi:pilus assembly protein Flp/PilA